MVNASQHDDAAYRRARAQQGASYMSDAKWRRLFLAAAASGAPVEMARWDVLGDDGYSFWEPLPAETDLLPTGLTDGRYRLLAYRWIRAIFIPREFRPVQDVGYTRAQDIGTLRRALEAAGEFAIEETDEGLTIMGYRA